MSPKHKFTKTDISPKLHSLEVDSIEVFFLLLEA